MKVMVRGYGDGEMLFEDLFDYEEQSANQLDDLVKKHLLRVIKFEKHMLELEFIEDAPNQDRFVRFGTDKSMMVNPMPIPKGWVKEWVN